jgi:hypothetical protein
MEGNPMTRPLVRVPILLQCPKCGRRSRPGGLLCVRCKRDATLRADLARSFPKLPMTREEERQAREAAEFGNSVLTEYVPPACSHGYDDRSDCPACTSIADWDDGEGA